MAFSPCQGLQPKSKGLQPSTGVRVPTRPPWSKSSGSTKIPERVSEGPPEEASNRASDASGRSRTSSRAAEVLRSARALRVPG
eukprot:11716093-Alexandrium_andersonii.AAC.1